MKTNRILIIAIIALFSFAACNGGSDKSKSEEKVEKEVKKKINEAFGGDMFKAAREGDLETIKKGIKAGEDVNKTNSYGETMLMKAAERGHFDVVKYLLEKGADKTKTDLYDNTAAGIAAEEEIGEYIRNYGENEE